MNWGLGIAPRTSRPPSRLVAEDIFAASANAVAVVVVVVV